MINLKEKLQNRELTIGSWITLAHPAIPEILASAGFEWLVVDLEHSVITIREAEELIRIIELSGVVPLVRLSSCDPVQIKRVMGAGAYGIIIPKVGGGLSIIAANQSVHYPPIGYRGVGIARAQRYRDNLEDYKEWLNKQVVVIAQIESKLGLSNIEEISEQCDAIMIGPYDLSASMGLSIDSADFQKLLGSLSYLQNDKCSAGIHVVKPEPYTVEERVKQGYTFIAYSTDYMFMGEKSRWDMKDIKETLLQ